MARQAIPKYYGLDMIYIYGDVYLKKKQYSVCNVFWREVIQSVYSIYIDANIRSLTHLTSMPIWYNTKFMEEKIQTWVDKGISSIGDLLDVNGQLLPIEYIQNVLELKCDFLLYNRIKWKLQNVLGNNNMTELDNVCPRVPFILHIIEVGSKGNKNTYFGSSSLNNNVIVELKDKWCKTMNDE